MIFFVVVIPMSLPHIAVSTITKSESVPNRGKSFLLSRILVVTSCASALLVLFCDRLILILLGVPRSRLRHKFVANSMDRSKQNWMRRIFFEFLSQADDVIVHGSCSGSFSPLAAALNECFARDDTFRLGNEKL